MHTDWTIYISFLGAGLILLLPRESKSVIRWTARQSGMVVRRQFLTNAKCQESRVDP